MRCPSFYTCQGTYSNATLYSIVFKSLYSYRKKNLSVVIQQYDTDVNKEYIIRGNAGILKCQVPSFVGDYLNIVAWHTDHNETFAANDENYGTSN